MADSFLSQDEVDALLKGVADEVDEVPVEATAPHAVRPYNLATQERIVRGRMPTLEIINERFARLFRASLRSYVQRTVGVSTGSIRLQKYDAFVGALAMPANLNLIKLNPLRGNAFLVLDAGLVYLIVDALFGGDGRFQSGIDGRDFTQTEHRIIRRMIDIVFDCYAKSWAPIHQVAFEYVRSETNTQIVNIALPNELVACVSFGIEIGQASGEMHLCLPYAMIEPIRHLLADTPRSEAAVANQSWLRLMRQQVQLAEVELVADLGTARVSLRDIVNLKAGDVIPLDIPPTVEARVDGVPVMECAYGKFNGQYTLRVEKLLAADANEIPTGESHV